MGMRRSCPVLVGREEELRALEAAVVDRRARPVILIGGEAGVGKTRLVAELAAAVVGSGAATAIGACVHLGAESLPFAPFVDGLGRYLDALGDRAAEVVGAGRSDLAVLLPDLAAATGSGARIVDDAGPGRGRLYEAVRRLLDRAPDPLMLVIEDIHWADQSSLELLVYLASRLREGRTALVATFRTDELHRRHPLVPVLAELARSGKAARVDLERLGPDEVAGMVRAVEGDVPDARVAAVVARSDGNPFLVEELLSVLGGPGAPLPSTLRDVLVARLGLLGEPARRVLGIVAMLGRPADIRILETACASTLDLDAAIREAIDRAVLVADPMSGRLTFRHALIGEAVADDLLPGERIRVHAELARILAADTSLASATRAGAAGEIAHHLLEARDLPAALRASVRAGQAAAAARAYPEARAHFERAVDLAEDNPEALRETGLDRAGLLDAAADASFRSGDVARAVALGRRAVALAELDATTQPTRLSYLLGRLLEWLELSGDPTEVLQLAERAVALVPAQPASRELAHALLSLAAVRMHDGRDGAGGRVAEEAVRVAEACGATGIEACARAIVAISLAALARDDRAVEEIERAVALAERSLGAAEIGVTHIDRPAIYSAAGRFSDLPRVLAESRAVLEREGLLDLTEPFLASDEAELLVAEGRWSEAEALSDRILEAGPSRLPRATHLTDRGLLRIRSGRLEDGVADLRAALEIQPPVDPETRAGALAGLAEAALAASNPRRAIALVDEALVALNSTDEVTGRAQALALGLRAAADLAERARARREPQDGSDAAVAARYLAGLDAASTGALVAGAATGGRVDARVRWGRAEETRRAGRADPDGWAAAAEALATSGEHYLAALSRSEEAESALLIADRERATRCLRDVAEWAARVGAARLSDEVDALARRGRIDLAPHAECDAPTRGADRVAPFGLSPRELEVLAMLLDGRTNREIGAALFITDKTASSHVTHILDKLGVTSRGAAAAVAARAGLLLSRER